ncbi:hypothetical protein FV217_15980 [Methylobacterium sp. WL9]|nr:hypothetical protein FV217_15980 [Methylobacterium sp. WL9]
MSGTQAPSDRMAEVERLTAALTDQILDAQIMNRPISEDQAHALAKGARLLHDNGMPWPPVLAQVLQTLMDGRSEAEPEPEISTEATNASAPKGLSRFLGAFRREKGPLDQPTSESDGGAQG